MNILTGFIILENETFSQEIFTIAFTDEDINEDWTFAIVSADPATAAFICNQSTGKVVFFIISSMFMNCVLVSHAC